MSHRGSRSAILIGDFKSNFNKPSKRKLKIKIKSKKNKSDQPTVVQKRKCDPGKFYFQIKQNKFLIRKWKEELNELEKRKQIEVINKDSISEEISAVKYRIEIFEKGNANMINRIEEHKIQMAEKQKRKAEEKKTNPTQKIVNRIKSDL